VIGNLRGVYGPGDASAPHAQQASCPGHCNLMNGQSGRTSLQWRVPESLVRGQHTVCFSTIFCGKMSQLHRSREIEQVVMTTLAKDPHQRYGGRCRFRESPWNAFAADGSSSSEISYTARSVHRAHGKKRIRPCHLHTGIPRFLLELPPVPLATSLSPTQSHRLH